MLIYTDSHIGVDTMPRLKPNEKRAALMKKRAELDAQLRSIEAQERDAERKRDTRRKIVAGAIALEQIARDPTGAFAVRLKELLDEFVDARSRDLFPYLPPLPPTSGRRGRYRRHRARGGLVDDIVARRGNSARHKLTVGCGQKRAGAWRWGWRGARRERARNFRRVVPLKHLQLRARLRPHVQEVLREFARPIFP